MARSPKNSFRFTDADKAKWLGNIITDDRFSKKDFAVVLMISDKTVFNEKLNKNLAKKAPTVVHRALRKDSIKVTESHVKDVYVKLNRAGHLREYNSAQYYFMDVNK